MVVSPGCRAACVALACLLLFGLSLPALAQQILYEYDPLGRLILVSTPEGVAMYEYDAVGNILRIVTRRYADTADPLAVLMVSPTKGAAGTEVHIYGKGFATAPGDNQVAFNGTAALVSAATTTRLVTTVPASATTGPLTVTVGTLTATAPEPFTMLQGLAVVPDRATVLLGKSYSFQAALDGAPITSVTWRVNGIVGGNATLGTISPTGLYTAPSTLPPVSPLAIEAVLTADPSRIATAQVDLLPAGAGGMTAARLSVGPPQPSATASPLQAPSLSVAPPPPALTASPLVVSSLSVGPPEPALTASPLPASAVSVSSIPVITGVTPGSGARGGSVALTLTGVGLANPTTLVLLRNGTADPLITVSGLTAEPDGTRLTASLTIDATAPVGGRILQVTAGGRTSTPLGTGTNTFVVQ